METEGRQLSGGQKKKTERKGGCTQMPEEAKMYFWKKSQEFVNIPHYLLARDLYAYNTLWTLIYERKLSVDKTNG